MLPMFVWATPSTAIAAGIQDHLAIGIASTLKGT